MERYRYVDLGATSLNIFEVLRFDYKIKEGSEEECSPQLISDVMDLCNHLQLILKENEVREMVQKKSDNDLCVLQPVDPTFADLPVSSASELDRGNWELNHSQDVEEDIAVPEISFSSSTHKDGDIYTCQYCNRKYRTNKKFSKHVCKSAPVLPEPQDEDFVDDPELGQISQIGGWNQMRRDSVSTAAVGEQGVDALLKAAWLIEEQDKIGKIKEDTFVQLSDTVDHEEILSRDDYNGSPFTHDHTYMLPGRKIPVVKEEYVVEDEGWDSDEEGFEILQNQLPQELRDKPNNIVIYNAVWAIASLERKGKVLEEEMEKLKLKNLAYEHKLSLLKDELIAQRENLDLNNVVERIIEPEFGEAVDDQKAENDSEYKSFPLSSESNTISARVIKYPNSSCLTETTNVAAQLPTVFPYLMPDAPFVPPHITNVRVRDKSRDLNHNRVGETPPAFVWREKTLKRRKKVPLQNRIVLQLRDQNVMSYPLHIPVLNVDTSAAKSSQVSSDRLSSS